MVGVAGLEPAGLLVPNQALFQLSYTPKMESAAGIEPASYDVCSVAPGHWAMPTRWLSRKDSNLQISWARTRGLANLATAQRDGWEPVIEDSACPHARLRSPRGKWWDGRGSNRPCPSYQSMIWSGRVELNHRASNYPFNRVSGGGDTSR